MTCATWLIHLINSIRAVGDLIVALFYYPLLRELERDKTIVFVRPYIRPYFNMSASKLTESWEDFKIRNGNNNKTVCIEYHPRLYPWDKVKCKNRALHYCLHSTFQLLERFSNNVVEMLTILKQCEERNTQVPFPKSRPHLEVIGKN